MKTRRKRKKRIGSSLFVLFILIVGATLQADKKKFAEPFGQVGVTVFREPGFALSGVEVNMVPIASEPNPKGKPFKGVTDGRGEVVFRVPTARMR